MTLLILRYGTGTRYGCSMSLLRAASSILILPLSNEAHFVSSLLLEAAPHLDSSSRRGNRRQGLKLFWHYPCGRDE